MFWYITNKFLPLLCALLVQSLTSGMSVGKFSSIYIDQSVRKMMSASVEQSVTELMRHFEDYARHLYARCQHQYRHSDSCQQRLHALCGILQTDLTGDCTVFKWILEARAFLHYNVTFTRFSLKGASVVEATHPLSSTLER